MDEDSEHNFLRGWKDRLKFDPVLPQENGAYEAADDYLEQLLKLNVNTQEGVGTSSTIQPEEKNDAQVEEYMRPPVAAAESINSSAPVSHSGELPVDESGMSPMVQFKGIIDPQVMEDMHLQVSAAEELHAGSTFSHPNELPADSYQTETLSPSMQGELGTSFTVQLAGMADFQDIKYIQSPVHTAEYMSEIPTSNNHWIPYNYCGIDPTTGSGWYGWDVPQEPYHAQTQSFTPTLTIRFPRMISLRKALEKDFNGLDSVEWGKPAFASYKSAQKLSIRIGWPGYPLWSHQQNVTKSENGGIAGKSVSNIAHEVAKAVRDFIQKHESMITTSNFWRVGAGAIKLENIYCAGVEHVSKGSLQPVLAIFRDQPSSFEA